ncbi:8-amino-7-oxononanoate synthase [Paenibacillus oenotherae]|uniref:8-amino-7-ketopelargonate synthase n=1 Tax=Paenibacillus oenotherae TaxID=1435645 RepID=A0ABS7D6K8_9BACL|nr:8-amino-7-oxononanoate synthase [Paenibacillus oenotherae]MBW7475146.1 8-amino-7-oxononanoate synthase [Paenibacillus oenotherae]
MEWMEQELAALADKALERQLRDSAPIAGRPGFIIRDGQELLDLSSNDYLGLAQHPAIIEAMRTALAADGAGSGASRLVTGNRPPYRKLEQALASWQGTDAALVAANGYMANTGVISALVGRGDAVFSDRLNHASIVDGITLSRADHARYRHNDLEHLRHLLDKHRGARRKLIVTDTIFSMDGDQALLPELVALKEQYGAMLMVDEAHSGGIYGTRGEGLCHALGIQNDIDVHMGTFSKAFGVYGAYVSGSRTLIRWLINKARPFIYSTALPPAVVAGISQALQLVQTEHGRRQRLLAAGLKFRSALQDAGFQVGEGNSPIVPVIIGDNGLALAFSAALQASGIAAVAIRPPTVPEGTARIRFSLSAAHSDDALQDAARHIRSLGIEMGVLKQ